MKSLKIVSAAILVCIIYAVPTSLHAQSNWDEDHHIITLKQNASINYKIEGGQFEKLGNPKGMALRWDWVLPDHGMWAYFDFSSVFVPQENKYGFFALGYGVMFNNKRPITIGSAVAIKLGAGFSFGGSYFNASGTNAEVAVIPLEIGSFIKVGNHINLFPKVGIQPLYGRDSGGRVFADLKSTLRITNWLGFNFTTGVDRYYFNEESKIRDKSSGQATAGEIFKITYMRFGIVLMSGRN